MTPPKQYRIELREVSSRKLFSVFPDILESIFHCSNVLTRKILTKPFRDAPTALLAELEINWLTSS